MQGFVYITDAKTAEPGTIKIVTNVSVSTPVTYPIAVVSSSENKEKAQEFLDFVTGKEGQEILEEIRFCSLILIRYRTYNRTYALRCKIMYNRRCVKVIHQAVEGLLLLISQFNCVSPNLMLIP